MGGVCDRPWLRRSSGTGSGGAQAGMHGGTWGCGALRAPRNATTYQCQSSGAGEAANEPATHCWMHSRCSDSWHCLQLQICGDLLGKRRTGHGAPCQRSEWHRGTRDSSASRHLPPLRSARPCAPLRGCISTRGIEKHATTAQFGAEQPWPMSAYPCSAAASSAAASSAGSSAMPRRHEILPRKRCAPRASWLGVRRPQLASRHMRTALDRTRLERTRLRAGASLA